MPFQVFQKRRQQQTSRTQVFLWPCRVMRTLFLATATKTPRTCKRCIHVGKTNDETGLFFVCRGTYRIRRKNFNALPKPHDPRSATSTNSKHAHPSQDVPELLRLLALLASKNQALLAWPWSARDGFLQQSLEVADSVGRFEANDFAAGAVVHVGDAELDGGAEAASCRSHHLGLRVRASRPPRPRPRVGFCCSRRCRHHAKQALKTEYDMILSLRMIAVSRKRT